jgi:hypothetical protein
MPYTITGEADTNCEDQDLSSILPMNYDADGAGILSLEWNHELHQASGDADFL